jgi:hypothetical protein
LYLLSPLPYLLPVIQALLWTNMEVTKPSHIAFLEAEGGSKALLEAVRTFKVDVNKPHRCRLFQRR